MPNDFSLGRWGELACMLIIIPHEDGLRWLLSCLHAMALGHMKDKVPREDSLGPRADAA
jgi:hypothetical protein